MKSEELKIIAEGMGYKSYINNKNNNAYIVHPMDLDHYLYTPYTTNDTQCMEIMEKLKIPIIYNFKGEYWLADESRGKTINEAVCRAALAYFKGDVNGY